MMSILLQTWRWMLALLRRGRYEREMEEEMRFHFEMQIEQNVASGMAAEEARYAARRQFGNQTWLKEASREMWSLNSIETLIQDMRYGARMLLKNPGFTAISALTLALGIGANTAIFTVVNAVMLNPFAYPDADQIMYLSQYDLTRSADTASVSYPNFLDWQKQQTMFTHLAAARSQTFNMTRVGEPIYVNGAMISPDTFPLLEVPPQLGRVFTEQDNRLDSSRTVVLSYEFWQLRFGGENDVIGRTILFDNQDYTVIGVMPPHFKFWGVEVWVPYGLFGNAEHAISRMMMGGTGVVGRLKPGLTITQARAELSLIAARLAQQYPDSNKDFGAMIIPLNESVSHAIRPALLILLGCVGLVLLIACANVANLLIARAATREKELAIRVALGAGRARLLRQLVLECMPLAMLGSIAGLLLARSALVLILRLLPEDIIPAETSLDINARVLGFTLFITLLTTLICSLLPALRFSRNAALEGLRYGMRISTGASGNLRMRGVLVTFEVAMTVILLVAAGLLIKSFARLQQVELGFNKESLLTIDLSLSSDRYNQPQQPRLFYREALERVIATPGVESAAFMNGAPFTNSGISLPLIREGQYFADHQELSHRVCRFSITHGDMMSALGSPLIDGRGFTSQDTSDSEPVAIINQAAAEKFFHGENPLGKRIKLGLPDNLIQPGMLPEGAGTFSWLTVVGVVKNIRRTVLGQENQAAGYVPLAQAPPHFPFLLKSTTLLVRSTKEPVSLVNAVRRQIQSIDPDLPLAKVATMEARIDDSLKPQRFNTFLMGLFATLALLLAVVGLYGVLSYTVVQRKHEIGVRMALGAQTRDVLGLVVRQGMTLTLMGMGIGLIVALGLTRLIKNMLFGVSATDPATFIVIALLLAMVALLACYLPARRATKVDPMVALRNE
jgi:putative ABC transport system permease protein